MKTYADLQTAIRAATKLAQEGPRVAAVAECTRVGKGNGNKWAALPGYMDADLDWLKQVLLITPDGRRWQCRTLTARSANSKKDK